MDGSVSGFVGPFVLSLGMYHGHCFRKVGRRLTLSHGDQERARVETYVAQSGDLHIRIVGIGQICVPKESIGQGILPVGWATIEIVSDQVGCVVKLVNGDPSRTLIQAIPWDPERKVSTFVSVAMRQFWTLARQAKSLMSQEPRCPGLYPCP